MGAIEDLQVQIEINERRTERECAALLKDICNILLPIDHGQILYIDSEQYNSNGRVDLVIHATQMDAFGSERRVAYVWELKAPQLSLVTIDTENRAQPTEHLYDAENQLIHYQYALSNDASYRARNQILSQDDVRFGGIIIGRHDNYVQPSSMNKEKAKNISKEAMRIRDQLFYRPHGIYIWTWDHVLDRAKKIQHSFQSKEGNATTTIKATLNVTLPGLIVKATGHVE